MKINPKFQWLTILTSCCLLLLPFSACKKSTQAKVISENASKYVYGYTTGTISAEAPIRVRFADPLVTEDQIGQQAASNLIRFRPAISGTTRWEDDRTLIFQPDEWLDAKTSFLATVALSELFPNAPADAKTFEFNFQTREQSLEVYVDGLETENPKDLSTQMLKGSVYTADVAKSDLIEQTLNVLQSGANLPIEWTHNKDHKSHQFVVKSINRTQQSGQVDIQWNGKKIGVQEKNTKSIEVPAIGDFKVMNARVIQGADQYILMHFSDPLLASQDFKGLVKINGYSGNLRYTVDRNQLRAYPASRISGNKKITIQPGIRNSLKAKMTNPTQWNLAFEDVKPQVRLVGSGVIMPQSNGLIFPFEAVNLQAVDVEVFKIFHNNIMQYLQSSSISSGGDNYRLERVGRVVLQKKITLNTLNPKASSANWTRYALDLGKMIDQDPDAIYQVRIGFRKSYSNYACNNAPEAVLATNNTNHTSETEEDLISIWEDNYYGVDGYYEGFSWEHRKNPCFPAYYNTDRFIRRNVVASNLGITVKQGKDGSVFAAVANINTATPISGVKIEFYDFQQQLITAVTTDSEGTATIDLDRKGFMAIAKKDDQRGFLQMDDATTLSLSRFDVGGTQVQKGIKGYIYGERGVWRPGDSLFLNFILEDKLGKLPEKHPVTFELYDARNQLKKQIVTDDHVNNIYPFPVATQADDPTGNWRAVVKVGGAKFSKTLKVETVKPNRLKVLIDFGEERLTHNNGTINGDLQVNWLHGAPAKNLKAKVEANIRNTSTRFSKFKSYVFRDPARKFSGEPVTVFDDKVNGQGYAAIAANLISNTKNLPGKMRVDFRTRAFENGGDFSEDNFGIDFDPFDAYAGVAIPTNRYKQKRLNINEAKDIEFALVDTEGNPLSGRDLNVGLYRVNWRWWWDRNDSQVSRYNSSTHMNAQEKEVVTTNAKGIAKWSTKVTGWGRYLIRVCDPVSGHCSGDYFYAGYPWYNGEGGKKNREGASMLVFMADKEKYEVGEQVELTIPTSGEGRVLVSIESGSKVLETYWRDADEGETKFKFYATEEMTPTVYANVSFIQPHGQIENDLPIRMYGVIPINVENPKTRLEPKIKMAEVLQPKEKVSIEVSENNGRPMAYTVALVDDGLLDLTRFKTPDAWNSFYAREALGVKTWDVYDEVLGAYGGQLERLLSIGGDDVVGPGEANTSANRFQPVVKTFGPFYLEAGTTVAHEFTMPNYVGSVRTMVVAADNGAYGMAEKTCPVRQPLMVLATLPRVLGPGEKLSLPVNVFAMEDKVKEVTVTVEESSGLIQFEEGQSKQINFSNPGDQIVTFDISILERIGVANFKITASGNGEQASQDIEILVRNPNPPSTDVVESTIEAGKEWTTDYNAMGVRGTNTALLEVSAIPSLNLEDRLQYLIRYPHGCIEQTTSSVFPQLVVDALLELDADQKQEIETNIKAGIDRLSKFQNNAGGFAYWPGDNGVSHWGTNYAGHFLLEAQDKGYQVSPLLLDKLMAFQKKIARRWDPEIEDSARGRAGTTMMQAYRLYVLALGGQPELGAMNRLREMNQLPQGTAWRLAGAYALAGKKEVADDLINDLSTQVNDYVELSYTYGSGLRDQAMILEVLSLLGEKTKAANMARTIAKKIGGGRWYATQTVAYSLLSMGKFIGESDATKELKFSYQKNDGQWIDAGSDRPIMQIDLPENGGSVAVRNASNGTLFTRLVLRGQPLVGDQSEASNDLKMSVTYKTTNGKTLDPTTIEQGTDFIAEVTITNPGVRGIYYKEMALSQVFPSGWEILNTRMSNVQQFKDSAVPTYQDIRDDRVYSYFNIGAKKSKTYRVQLNAAYCGRYYLPSVACEAMYDYTINARKPGRWVEVVKPAEL